MNIASFRADIRFRRWKRSVVCFALGGVIFALCAENLVAGNVAIGQGAAREEPEKAFARANEAYKRGDYRAAAEIYENLVAVGVEAKEAYYNLGNCYYKLGNVAAAILNYERARRLAPADDDIQYNLELAQSRIADNIEPAPELFLITWFHAFVAQMTSDVWAACGVAALWLCFGSMAAFFVVLKPMLKKTFFVAGAALALCCGLCFLFARLQSCPETTAIIFSTTVVAKSEPREESKDLFILHEGVKVEILGKEGDWRKIRVADGSVGWLRSNAAQEI
jgi:multidrug efflux pump subunit AcrA (membrane-fusion protein)